HEKKPYFLFVGRLSPEKGVRVLLQVWNNLYSDSALLKVVGDGPQSAVLKQYCTEKGLGTVRFLGSRSLASVLDLMQGAQAVVVPSQWYETFGRVVVEAFACGRPAIVSDLGALAELVEEGETGFKVSPYDPQAWADRIRWCIDHPVKLEEMGRKARQCYLANYTPEINYRQLMAIYQKVLNS
ncbi:MAG: glycosyltransferase family 4 protein, partial [Leptolyngbya sp.]|nr:glycosyltransferase family 4 protein [Leptolyngbya sp.]